MYNNLSGSTANMVHLPFEVGIRALMRWVGIHPNKDTIRFLTIQVFTDVVHLYYLKAAAVELCCPDAKRLNASLRW